MSTLLWVAVPGGVATSTTAPLRVLLVPRLRGLADDATLTAYGFADWPSRLADALPGLVVERADDPAGFTTPLDFEPVLPPPGQRPTWSEVFAPTTRVRPFSPLPTYERNALHVERTSAHAGAVRDVYTEVAAHGGQPEMIATPLGNADLAGIPPTVQTTATDAPVVPEPDFHRAVAALREHPTVLQSIGLVVELRLTNLGQLGDRGLVRVRCLVDDDLPAVSGEFPWTAYVHPVSPRHRFLPAPAPGSVSDLADGMVTLESGHSFATFDVTGAVERLREDATRARDGAETPTALPALRSAGLSVLRQDRAAVLESRRERSRLNRSRGSLDGGVLHAEDLVLGYRFDVRSSSAGWRSLMRRRASYAGADRDPTEVPPVLEEGQTKVNGATVDGSRQVDETDADERLPALRADEVVVRWDGWSLSCPKPGTDAARGAPGRKRAPFLSWHHEPVGLPLLRFGENYRVRARVADVAGGGLRPGEPGSTEHESEETFYGRHDPVPAPFLVPPEGPLGPGGSADTLVIRSSPLDGLATDDLAADHVPNDRRTLLPPSAPWFLLDAHGQFGDHQDPVLPGEPDEATYAAWLERCISPEAHDANGRYSWLPDPMAEGAALTVRAEPGTPSPGETVREAWTVPEATWPDFQHKSLLLTEPTASAPGRLDWSDDHRTALVRLRPGEQVWIDLTSTVPQGDLGLFAMDDWLEHPRAGLPAGSLSLDEVARRVHEGRHPMVSPPRLLHLVHAVPRPVRRPAGSVTPVRSAGQSYVDLRPTSASPGGGLAELDVHVPSTGQVELRASWREVVDGPGRLAEQDVSGLLVQVATVEPDATTLPLLRHELADTRHRRITYALRGVSRYREYFVADPDDPGQFSTPDLEMAVSVPSSARPPEPVVLSVAPALRWSGTELPAGWTEVTRTRAGGIVRVELARPWLVSGEGELLAVVLAGPGEAVPATTLRRDPVWSTPAPPVTATAELFTGFDAAADHPVPGLGTATVVGYRPELVGQGDSARWVADVDLSRVADASYSAFASLVVARYQPESVADLHVSRGVRVDPVQLLPNRTLHVRRTGTDVTVTLTGLAPQPGGGQSPPRVDLQLEATTEPGSTDLTAATGGLGVGWQRVQSVSGGLGEDLSVPLPVGAGALRIVVREVEPYDPMLAGVAPADELSERVVFLDVVPLD